MSGGSSPLMAQMPQKIMKPKASASQVSPMEVFKSIENRDRASIKEIVMRDDVSLGLTDSVSGRSLLYCLLKKVCNGDKLVKEKLDSCISSTNRDPDSDEFMVLVDHSKLILEEDRSNLVVIEDLIKLPRRACRRVLHHPVILSYIQNKWLKTRWTFLVSFLLYLLFLIMYSSFLGMLYHRNSDLPEVEMIKFPETCSQKQLAEVNCTPLKVNPAKLIKPPDPPESGEEDDDDSGENSIVFRTSVRQGQGPKKLSPPSPPNYNDAVVFADSATDVTISVQKKKKNRTRSRVEGKSGLFSGCFASVHNGCEPKFNKRGRALKCRDVSHCIVEILLVFSIILLVLQELWQCMALKKQYFKELENWFELVILSFAISTLFLKQNLDNLTTVAALGICLAWLELIFLFGRYPSLGGKFSIMYYTATKRVIKTALGFFVMIIGFSFSFFIINFGTDNESFNNVYRSSLKILSMMLGEFEFDDLYENSSEQGDLTVSFTMILFLGLIVFGSIIMVNLIVAIIITDIEWLNQMSKEQALLNQAQHALQIHALFSFFTCTSRVGQKNGRNDLMKEYCTHSICACTKPRLPRGSKDLVFNILKLS